MGSKLEIHYGRQKDASLEQVEQAVLCHGRNGMGGKYRATLEPDAATCDKCRGILFGKFDGQPFAAPASF